MAQDRDSGWRLDVQALMVDRALFPEPAAVVRSESFSLHLINEKYNHAEVFVAKKTRRKEKVSVGAKQTAVPVGWLWSAPPKAKPRGRSDEPALEMSFIRLRLAIFLHFSSLLQPLNCIISIEDRRSKVAGAHHSSLQLRPPAYDSITRTPSREGTTSLWIATSNARKTAKRVR